MHDDHAARRSATDPRSSLGLQFTRIEQKIPGKTPGGPVSIVTDDDDSLLFAYDARAYALSPLDPAQARNT